MTIEILHGYGEQGLPSMAEQEMVGLLERRRLWTPLVGRAMLRTQRSHHDQVRDSGAPYLNEHIYPVAANVVAAYAADYDLSPPPEEIGVAIVLALLHDTVEDDPKFTIGMCKNEFGPIIADGVWLLTKPPEDNDPHLPESKKRIINQRMLQQVRTAPKRAPKIVRLADRVNNLESAPSIRDTNPERFQRIVDETAEVYLPFAKEISPYFARRLHVILAALQSPRTVEES
jgi:(p)ppGpp synthase/HD superfamily hydrolase